MGNLFFRGQQISEIKKLGFKEMKYWNNWHELMVKAEKDQIKKNTGKK